jgi:cell division protein FtsZ
LPADHATSLPLERHHDETGRTIEKNSIKDKQIKLLGVGGCGCNAVDYMITSGLQGVEFICANTEAEVLSQSRALKTIQLGSSGLSTGSQPERARDVAIEAEAAIRAAIDGADMLFITAGMGGGTGTGAAPVIARIAKEMGILTVGLVTMPFEFEGDLRLGNAQAGLLELQANVDTLIVLANEKLLLILGDEVTQSEAFAFINEQLKNTIGGMVDLINARVVNADLLDKRLYLDA